MRAVDTNLVLRLIVNDDPAQTAVARRAMAAEPVFIPKTVILELEWVLRSVYQRPPTLIATALAALLNATDIHVEDSATVGRAIDWFRRGLDLADALHLASSSHADGFLTFDSAMRRRATRLEAQPTTIAP